MKCHSAPYGMPFAHLFQDMHGRTKMAGEDQDDQRENQEWEIERQDARKRDKI